MQRRTYRWLTRTANREQLVAHWRDNATELDARRPVGMSDPERLYNEMVWAIAKDRFGPDVIVTFRDYTPPPPAPGERQMGG